LTFRDLPRSRERRLLGGAAGFLEDHRLALLTYRKKSGASEGGQTRSQLLLFVSVEPGVREDGGGSSAKGQDVGSFLDRAGEPATLPRTRPGDGVARARRAGSARRSRARCRACDGDQRTGLAFPPGRGEGLAASGAVLCVLLRAIFDDSAIYTALPGSDLERAKLQDLLAARFIAPMTRVRISDFWARGCTGQS